MDRIILPQKVKAGQKVVIKGPPLEALRFRGGRVGSLVTLTDEEGNDLRGRVVSLSEAEASIFVFDAFASPTESLFEIVLFQVLPEKERMEWIIQKTTELGVARIIVFESKRSISLRERQSRRKPIGGRTLRSRRASNRGGRRSPGWNSFLPSKKR